MDGVLAGLGAAHDAGMAHRDVKPENVLLGDAHAVKVADFGLARLHAGAAQTKSGMIIGTAAYLAPGAGVRRLADVRTDVYAAGMHAVRAAHRPAAVYRLTPRSRSPTDTSTRSSRRRPASCPACRPRWTPWWRWRPAGIRSCARPTPGSSCVPSPAPGMACRWMSRRPRRTPRRPAALPGLPGAAVAASASCPAALPGPTPRERTPLRRARSSRRCGQPRRPADWPSTPPGRAVRATVRRVAADAAAGWPAPPQDGGGVAMIPGMPTRPCRPTESRAPARSGCPSPTARSPTRPSSSPRPTPLRGRAREPRLQRLLFSRRLAYLAAGLAVLLVFGLLGWWMLQGRYTIVPKVTGVSAATAKYDLRNEGLTPGTTTTVLDNGVAKGLVIRTSPANGSRITRGGTVEPGRVGRPAHDHHAAGDRADADRCAGGDQARGPGPRQGEDGHVHHDRRRRSSSPPIPVPARPGRSPSRCPSC